MVSLILTILGILAFLFNSYIGFILTIIGLFLAKSGKKKNEKYTKEAYTIALTAAIIESIVLIIITVYTIINVSNIIEDTNDKLEKINENYAAE